MNEQAFQDICRLLDGAKVPYQVYKHEICRTSEESARVRKAISMPDSIGAKALLCKMDFRSGSEFVSLVLPGTHALDKQLLKTHLPELKQFRFATPEELMELAGVVPGCMPPFGKQIFPGVSRLYISEAIKNFDRVAFNAAKLDVSITLTTADYLRTVQPDDVFLFSKLKE